METRDLAHEYLKLMARIITNAPFNRVQEFSRGELMTLRNLELAERNGEAVTPGDISQSAGLSTARVANVLNSLEKKGLVARVHDVQDRRRVFVTLTDDGRVLINRKSAEILADAEDVLKSLGEKDAHEFLRLLRRMVDYQTARE